MANMSYCRFENTALDLLDCYENFDDDLEGKEREIRARRIIIKLACDIAENYGDEVTETHHTTQAITEE
jgi:hypothetical protein